MFHRETSRQSSKVNLDSTKVSGKVKGRLRPSVRRFQRPLNCRAPAATAHFTVVGRHEVKGHNCIPRANGKTMGFQYRINKRLTIATIDRPLPVGHFVFNSKGQRSTSSGTWPQWRQLKPVNNCCNAAT